jgi:putative transposase
VCLLPDHLHCVWKLPAGDDDFSTRWALIKKRFTRDYLKTGAIEGMQSDSRIHKRERGIWQRRFWEHRIRDESDLQRHIDYVHFNPVKHRLVEKVEDWPYSSYHRYMASGRYAKEYFTKLQKEYEDVFAGE